MPPTAETTGAMAEGSEPATLETLDTTSGMMLPTAPVGSAVGIATDGRPLMPAPAPMPTEMDTAGREIAGRETAGRETAGIETAGRETAGRETAGRETAGRETDGRETEGSEIDGVGLDPYREISGASHCAVEDTYRRAGLEEGLAVEVDDHAVSTEDGAEALFE